MMEIQPKASCAERVIVERMNFVVAVVAVVVEQRTVLRRGKNHRTVSINIANFDFSP